MNLVQLQERLKDAPTQTIMQYANGGNPMVPPYLALAELQRRDSINKSAANQQALAQGAQPSVKEQIEQAAGLAALQKQTQAKGLQSLMGAGVPVPPVPTPERQPQAEGVATLPTNEMYNFAEGGIIGYAGGDLVRGDSDWMSESLQAPELVQDSVSRKPTREEINRIVEALQSKGERISLSTIKDIEAGRIKLSDVQPPPIAAPQSPAQLAPATSPQDQQQAVSPLQQGITSGSPAQRTSSGQQAPVGRASPRGGIADLPGADEAQKMMLGAMRSKTTLEDQYAEQQKAKGLFGLQQPYGEERMKRIQQMQTERQQMLEPRGTERLMRVLGGIAGRGLQGAGPAYLQAIEGERASDMDFRAKMDELMAGTEEKRRAEAVSGMTDAQKNVAEERKLGLGAAEKVYDAQQQRELKQAEMEFRRLENKANQQQRLTPREQFLVNYAGGNFEKYLEGVRKVSESEQGPRADMASERSRTALFNKYNENPMLKSQYKTFEDYIKAFEAATGEKTASDPLMSKADSILAGRK